VRWDNKSLTRHHHDTSGAEDILDSLIGIFMLLAAFSGSASDKPARSVTAPAQVSPVIATEPDEEHALRHRPRLQHLHPVTGARPEIS
jgi:hypothetical protein